MMNALPIDRSLLFARRSLFCAAAMMALGTAVAARAQALPAAQASPISTGFSIPELGGSWRWAVSASQSLDWGYYSQSHTAYGTNLSGDVAYLSKSIHRPFSFVLSGGRTWGNSGEPSFEFASLGLSQVFNVGRWNFTLSDSVSYLPDTATYNLSGVPGVGDVGIPPYQAGPVTGQGLLVNYSPEVTNSSAASVQRQITGKTALNASGSYSLLRFVHGTVGGSGLENDSVTGSAGFTHRLTPRNSYGGNYAYTSVIFLDNLSAAIPALNFVSQTASFTYSRQVSRRLTLNLAAGPQWTQINFAQTSPSLNAYADASATYANEFGRMSLDYVRSTNSGWGVVGGSLSDSVTFSGSRIYGRVWNTSASIAWTRSTSLPTPNAPAYDFNTVVAGFQISRALAHNLSGFASYTVERQTNGSSAKALDLFSGTNQIFAVGVTYSPAARGFGRP